MTSILTTIENFVEPYITQVLDLLGGFPVWAQGAILLGLGIFTIIGVFVFLKKFIKLFVVLAILGGVFYFVYSQGYLDSLLGYVQTIGTNLSIF